MENAKVRKGPRLARTVLGPPFQLQAFCLSRQSPAMQSASLQPSAGLGQHLLHPIGLAASNLKGSLAAKFSSRWYLSSTHY